MRIPVKDGIEKLKKTETNKKEKPSFHYERPSHEDPSSVKYLNEPENQNEFLIRSVPNKRAPPPVKKTQPKKSGNISAYDNTKVNFKTGKSIAPAGGPKKMKAMEPTSTKLNKNVSSSQSNKTPKAVKSSKNSKPTDSWWNGIQSKEQPQHLYHTKPKSKNSLKDLAMKPAPVRSKNKVGTIEVYDRFK